MGMRATTDPKLVGDANKQLDRVKGKLFFKKGAGFLGPLLCKLNFHWTMDVPTAAVDGINLWWNPVFFNSLDEETQITILAHELWHIAYLHCVRGIGLEQDRYNIAADHVINLMLEEHGYYMDGFPYYRNKKYSKWSTEQVYDDLPPDPSGGGGGIGSDIVPGDSISDQAANDALSAVVGAATIARMTNKAGDIPGEVSLSIEHFLRPVLPWETLLRNFFNDLSEPERTFRRRNRRYNHMYLPGEAEITGLEHLMYGLDISGSISDENILRFNSEVKYIKEEFQPELLTLLTFDTHIRDEYVFEKDRSVQQNCCNRTWWY